MFLTALTLPLATDDDTAELGADLARILHPGDAVLLEGGIGAGKTHLCRALIRAALGRYEDVPSPTFTLVQTYDTPEFEIWHADLYRLSHPDEALELGLDSALEDAVCLVEWPDRLGDLTPKDALHLRLEIAGEGRIATLRCTRPGLLDDLRRVQGERIAPGDAVPLAGDASARRYARVGGHVLMDAPPGTGDDPADFVRIAKHLAGLGLSPPAIVAQDLPRGFLLLEDLGDDVFARLLDRDPTREAELYAPAVDVLRHLQSAPAPTLPDLAARDWAEAILPAFDWYRRLATGDQGNPAPTLAALEDAIRTHADGPRVMILRDYHAENLLWLPARAGLARVGLLDFQLAQMGQPGYDLVSLLQDARRDVSPETEAAMIERFDPSKAFRASYAVLGAQRGLRILGIFARLSAQGKPGYLRLIPRVWAQVQRNLAHPALALVRPDLPEPTPEVLERIAACCP
ncbi:tRNA (adenosine(37)-N6)-threonylcarbamoyltransferase complex ATPase subunit type 1 TsaE [Cereibacter sp. SYSU M97828]|nr:tRNA (adenosine(37)-N6)-threonylcarbamoyltransferase complex ATPase subunit type 1 TsaE [Cereibacter flavus]